MIRAGTPDDFPAAVAVIRAVWPAWVSSAAGLRHRHETVPAGARRSYWAAEVGGGLVGWCTAAFDHETAEPCGFVHLSVLPSHRRGGIGSALLHAALEHVASAGRARGNVDASSTSFAEGHGFRRRTTYTISAVDARSVAAVDAPSGVEIVPLASLDPAAVFALEAATIGDIPFEENTQLELAQWTRDYWEHPDRHLAAGTAACVDGRVVAACHVRADGAGRALTDYTATLPEFRGRGLARLVKSVALRRLAEDGVRSVFTANDASNAPMLAVNARLGYRPFAAEHHYER